MEAERRVDWHSGGAVIGGDDDEGVQVVGCRFGCSIASLWSHTLACIGTACPREGL